MAEWTSSSMFNASRTCFVWSSVRIPVVMSGGICWIIRTTRPSAVASSAIVLAVRRSTAAFVVMASGHLTATSVATSDHVTPGRSMSGATRRVTTLTCGHTLDQRRTPQKRHTSVYRVDPNRPVGIRSKRRQRPVRTANPPAYPPPSCRYPGTGGSRQAVASERVCREASERDVSLPPVSALTKG